VVFSDVDNFLSRAPYPFRRVWKMKMKPIELVMGKDGVWGVLGSSGIDCASLRGS
jgi:hypothetical protein